MVVFVSKKQPSSEKGRIQNLFQACHSIWNKKIMQGQNVKKQKSLVKHYLILNINKIQKTGEYKER